jgi:serine/threonine protein kinase
MNIMANMKEVHRIFKPFSISLWGSQIIEVGECEPQTIVDATLIVEYGKVALQILVDGKPVADTGVVGPGFKWQTKTATLKVKLQRGGRVSLKLYCPSIPGGAEGTVSLSCQKIEEERKEILEVRSKTIAAEMAPKIKVPGFPRELLAKYELLEFIGEGGFAKVFKVKSKLDGKIAALKILKSEEGVLETLRNEVAAWLSLDHENIVRLYGISKDPIPHLEMEFVEGIRIDGKIARDLGDLPKPVDEKTAIKLVRGIAEGLRHAHSKGVFHCDLKPQNILLSAEFKPKITDWGLANVRALSMGVEAFTLLYAAPEHLDSKHYGSTDNRTDIFQLGLIFYELLTGRLPFDVESTYQVMGSILSSEPFPPVSKYRSELSKFDGIISKMLAKRKEERFQSVDEFISALDLLEKGGPELENLLRRTSKKGFQI